MKQKVSETLHWVDSCLKIRCVIMLCAAYVCWKKAPFVNAIAIPRMVTNGTRAAALISHGTESKICAAANSVWLCGVRPRADERSVILMPSAWPHYWAYCGIKCEMMFTHGSSGDNLSHSLTLTWKAVSKGWVPRMRSLFQSVY